MRDTSLKGTASVYKFTLIQLLKSKGSIATIILMLVMSFVIMPIASFIVGKDDVSKEEVISDNVSNIYILNTTSLPLNATPHLIEKFPKASIKDSTAFPEMLGEKDMVITISFNENYKIDVDYSEDTLLPDSEAESAAGTMSWLIYDTIYKMAGVGDDVLSELKNGINISSDDADYFYSSNDYDASFALQYIYSILLMMFSMMSAGYIVRMIVEEKSSKLVELLMVSVKPLALITGKILAISTYIFGIIAMMILSFIGSSALTENLRSFDIGDLIATFGGSEMNFDLPVMIVIVLSFIVAYMTISIFSGIMGTACSSTEDMQSSTLSVTWVVMAGYMVSCFAVPFNGAFSYITSLIPIVSAFCTPVNYILGKVPLYIVIVSLIIQVIVLVLLAILCAKVYRELIVYNGKRIKFLDILKMAKKKGENSNA